MSEVVGGLLVKAEASAQSTRRRPSDQRVGDDEKREGAQQQRAGEDHALVQEIHRIQPAPENING
jgi:hypothetical protein